MLRYALLILSLLGQTYLSAAQSADQVYLIGGGPDVFNSQVQIEANVRWARRVIEALPGRRALHIWFTDGMDPAPDVTQWRAPAEHAEALQPLARVMGQQWSNGESYRNHRLAGEVASTEATHLREDLRRAFSSLKSDAWLIFNGHGRHRDQLNNTIELWNDTWLSVDELSDLIRAAPTSGRLRFLFTQCFAGAFSRLADTGENRCGFLAEAADREAEGCSAAIDSVGYQDYSSHFFAALNGRGRDDEPLGGDPDRDADGVVTPLEAHYYTLLTATSADIPRSTSEAYLSAWTPWYAKPLRGMLRQTDNPYEELAERLRQRAGVDSEQAMQTQQRRLRLEGQRLGQELEALGQQMDHYRGWLEREVLRRWPDSAYAYTRNFQRFLETDLNPAQDWIEAQAEYRRLLRLEAAYVSSDDRLLANQRALSRLEKIRHLDGLSAKLAVLRALGPSEARERYHALLSCESAPF